MVRSAEIANWERRMAAHGFVILTLAFRKEGLRWLGQCLELGTATDGRTLERVHEDLRELIEMHLEGLEEVGERERFFAERGIRFYTDELPDRVAPELPVGAEALYDVHRFEVGAGR